METVHHDGRTTAFRRVGTGDSPVVLYVHGSGSTHRVWAHQYGPGGPVHPAAAIDLSGHGESDDVEADAGSATLSAYVEDVRAVADETGADVLVGNSLGGAVVLQAVVEGVATPSALVIAGTGAKLAVADELRTLLADDFEAAVDALHDADRLFHDAEAKVVERSKEAMHAVGQHVTGRDLLTCHAFDVRGRLTEVEMPTLAICGERDALTPPRYHEYLAEHVRRGQFVSIPDAAHLAMVERPRAFNRELASFLDSIEIR